MMEHVVMGALRRPNVRCGECAITVGLDEPFVPAVGCSSPACAA